METAARTSAKRKTICNNDERSDETEKRGAGDSNRKWKWLEVCQMRNTMGGDLSQVNPAGAWAAGEGRGRV